ncbi:MAG: secondary thiamine-phosphate synthase enzyme YjbQ [Lentisphaeraceae bacterium]|nr:secondary thiamine-phosphate synthase enzyme YjbQ [Lentisphaeraceae bacterium]
MSWFQKTISLPAKSRGFHLVSSDVIQALPEISQFQIGIAHLFIRHTSASITINENADPSVRTDFESHFNKMVPENAPYYIHTYEGSDDMPAHLKSSILGSSITIPITNGKFNMGTWQGIYLCEHRDYAGSRKITITLNGE